MNQRIKQLALEADEYCRDYVPNWTMDHYNLKFAQLIAAECAKVAVFKASGLVATADVAGRMAAGRSIAAQMIKQHFEVEQ